MDQSLFDALAGDQEFQRELGRMVLAASRLERSLRICVAEHGGDTEEKAPLGAILKSMRHAMPTLSETFSETLEFSIRQRNYFVHNLCERLHACSTADFTASQFRSRVRGLADEILALTAIVEAARPPTSPIR